MVRVVGYTVNFGQLGLCETLILKKKNLILVKS